ncbi:hypothetical protein KC343_g16825 [Hortaea werneckii]|uniref:HhH-GPD domain-containing protein n=1 Tax=Hortaea werneckii TaxID=91943 RepID=A0A3M7CCM0_HORWE|nr:hypothetical protein KC352_g31847 [Hortaea werneckii]KAI7559987.1 hypothetical protein KC317_g10017 [Hortaea werneckii]KAI7597310.1 hypothetical protein KC343_g16825 [Hortaea werneckii]KAI7601396.1 hypothetical protein KC346_g12836 [Hortaea werneckii]KAI7661995.1 hypothetical protein KC319_g8253 [Hortaea werneckii]
MGPKKGAKKAGAVTPQSTSEAPKSEEVKTEDAPKQEEPEQKHSADAKSGEKRKKTGASDEPAKAPRRSGRGAPKAQPSKQQLLNFLLSESASALCRPDDETEDMKNRGDIRTYSNSVLTPFEELTCAVILSRPISHRLGLRTIRTILNPPYNFTSAKAVQDAGSEKHIQAVWDARTQHKEKTAGEIGMIADVVLEKFTAEGDKEGIRLEKVRTECNKDVEKEREMLKSNIKGLGRTGLDIFFRRVQWQWDAGYPFVDGKSAQSLYKLSLPDEGEELHKLIEQHWEKLETKQLAGEDEKAKKRRAFVIVLERATGADLEGKSEAVVEAAATG